MDYIPTTRQWVEQFVIALNLCPFAAVPFRKEQIRYVLEESTDTDQLVRTLLAECELLLNADPERVATTLIVHPHVLTDFLDYNDFLGIVEELLEEAGLSGILQVASFHPDYCFADVAPDDPANYTNRSPVPMLHLLREAGISAALETYPDPEQIPERNIRRLRAMGEAAIVRFWKDEK